MNRDIRRIVTRHDEDGQSVVHSDTRLTPQPIPTGDAEMALIWTTSAAPADNMGDLAGDKREAGVTLKGGTVIRIVDLKPGRSSPMHRSHSIDYGLVISGALELELDDGSVTRLGAGDIVVQRGTNHLWRNPSESEVCRIAFILIEAKPVEIGGVQIAESHG